MKHGPDSFYTRILIARRDSTDGETATIATVQSIGRGHYGYVIVVDGPGATALWPHLFLTRFGAIEVCVTCSVAELLTVLANDKSRLF